MKIFVISIGFLLLTLTVKSWELHEYSEGLNYCDWMGNAAYTVAMNRDLGIEENILIGEYLKQGNNYDEQVIVMNLIDQIYGPQKDKNAYDVKLEIESICLGTILSLNR